MHWLHQFYVAITLFFEQLIISSSFGVDSSIENSESIRVAARKGHFAVVKAISLYYSKIHFPIKLWRQNLYGL